MEYWERQRQQRLAGWMSIVAGCVGAVMIVMICIAAFPSDNGHYYAALDPNLCWVLACLFGLCTIFCAIIGIRAHIRGNR